METMEIEREEEIIDMSLSRAMQISGGNSFGHSIDFMPQGYGRNWSSENDIEDDPSPSVDRPLPIYLKFEDVQFKVKNIQANPVKAVVSSQLNTEKEKYKYILKGITRIVRPGELLALMGPSGSGKTTLLRIIGGRLQDNVKRKITYNETPFHPAIKRRIGFVATDDILYPQLTVEETLIIAAYLRLPKSMSRKQKLDRVEVIIKELGLERLTSDYTCQLINLCLTNFVPHIEQFSDVESANRGRHMSSVGILMVGSATPERAAAKHHHIEGKRSPFELELGNFFKNQKKKSDVSSVYGDGFRAANQVVLKY